MADIYERQWLNYDQSLQTYINQTKAAGVIQIGEHYQHLSTKRPNGKAIVACVPVLTGRSGMSVLKDNNRTAANKRANDKAGYADVAMTGSKKRKLL